MYVTDQTAYWPDWLRDGACINTAVIHCATEDVIVILTWNRPTRHHHLSREHLPRACSLHHCQQPNCPGQMGTMLHMAVVKHANHMTMTTSGLIMSWSDYLNTKGYVNINLQDLCETLIVYILLSTFQLVNMVLTVNKSYVRRFLAWIESADWKPW